MLGDELRYDMDFLRVPIKPGEFGVDVFRAVNDCTGDKADVRLATTAATSRGVMRNERRAEEAVFVFPHPGENCSMLRLSLLGHPGIQAVPEMWKTPKNVSPEVVQKNQVRTHTGVVDWLKGQIGETPRTVSGLIYAAEDLGLTKKDVDRGIAKLGADYYQDPEDMRWYVRLVPDDQLC